MKLVGVIIMAIAIILICSVASAKTEQVLIKDFAFHPDKITVQKGETVTWTHPGPASHTVKFSDSESQILKNGGQYSKTFNTAGTFNYQCGIHPNMKGTVIVK